MIRKTQLARTAFKRADPKPAKGTKPRKCKNRACRASFVPPQPFVEFCSPDCGAVLALERLAKQKAAKAKAERAADKAKREQRKKRTEWVADAQTAFNAFIRERDANQPCICCGAWEATEGQGGGWDAGHWISRGHASHLRFDERNVHKQRKGCNRPGGTTRAKYRVGLVDRIGEDKVRELEAIEYAPAEKMWSIDECKEIIATYRAKLKALKETA
jgi:hypothetical protein